MANCSSRWNSVGGCISVPSVWDLTRLDRDKEIEINLSLVIILHQVTSSVFSCFISGLLLIMKSLNYYSE